MANVLQVNFKYSMTTDQYRQAGDALADPFAAVPGCRWKIWLLDEANSAAGGIYLFENKAALDDLLASPLWASVGANPALSDFSIKAWDIMEGPSLVTRAPIEETVTA